MADVYIDGTKTPSTEDGTSWANAYISWATAFNGSNITAGDRVYVKNTESTTGDKTIDSDTSDAQNPVVVLGCKSATTNTPPVQSDLIPGWRTGEARTEAK